jgi:hypothetical protein
MSLSRIKDARGSAMLVALILAIASMWPVAANRSVILYPDSAGYFRAGSATLDMVRHAAERAAPNASTIESAANTKNKEIDTKGDGVSTQRSPYYGVMLVQLYELGGLTLLGVVQSVVLAITIVLALSRLGVDGVTKRLVAGLAVIVPGGAALFSATAMPDVYLGGMILAIAILLSYDDRLSWGERIWFYALVFAAMLFHRGNLSVAAPLLLFGGVGLMVARRRLFVSYAILLGLTVLAFAGHAAVDAMVLRVTGRPPISTPFLLARVVGDGTAEPYLKTHCASERFATCEFQQRMPMTENDFLWLNDRERGAYGAATEAVRSKISREESKIVAGVLRELPVQQLQASIGNAIRQFFSVGVTEYGNYDLLAGPGSSHGTPLGYRQSAIAAGELPLAALSVVMTVTYLASLAAVIAFAVRAAVHARRVGARPDADADRLWQVTFIVLLGLLGNAAVCGMLSGVFDRYQGRAAWIPALLALAWLLRTRTSDVRR